MAIHYAKVDLVIWLTIKHAVPRSTIVAPEGTLARYEITRPPMVIKRLMKIVLKIIFL